MSTATDISSCLLEEVSSKCFVLAMKRCFIFEHSKEMIIARWITIR